MRRGGEQEKDKGLSLDSVEIWHYLVKHGFLIRNASSHHLLTVDFILVIIIPGVRKEWSSKYYKLLKVKAIVSFTRLEF